ncbi:leucyl/phenylalanyl-tRNA--protein transferase [Comamonas humi]
MPPTTASPSLRWLTADDSFPEADEAWGPDTPHPGLLAAGGVVDSTHLKAAYARGIFPWYSPHSPPLWWSPDPRMVLQPGNFRLHRSLEKTLRRFAQDHTAQIRIDTAFAQVIDACSRIPREGQDGTWIVDDIKAAYTQLHREGLAHSVEVWRGERLVAGLYCVALGRAVFGESMFTTENDGSKIALTALVHLCRRHGVAMIDCQQNTRHLAFMGAAEVPRRQFLQAVREGIALAPVRWEFARTDWADIISLSEITSPIVDE